MQLISLIGFMISGVVTSLVVAAGDMPIVVSDTEIRVFDHAVLHWDRNFPQITEPDGFVARFAKQSVLKTIELPALPADQKDAQRIIATISVEPNMVIQNDQRKPADPWTRLGVLSVQLPDGDNVSGGEVELSRFITGYGGMGVFEVDLTAFAPLLNGTRTLRLFISTYSDEPGWKVSLNLRYTADAVGVRRPKVLLPVFHKPYVTADNPKMTTQIQVPVGMDLPRMRLICTGHATDGGADDEFTSRTHVLRIDGREIARFRPWVEGSALVRADNPWAGRKEIDGREVWSSDFDRAGWQPGRLVTPLVIPIPELTPGSHRIELEILDIPSSDPTEVRSGHAYWIVSAVIMADEPWPVTDDEKSQDESDQ